MTKRGQYIGKAKAKLDQWDTDFYKFKAKVSASDADAQIEYMSSSARGAISASRPMQS